MFHRDFKILHRTKSLPRAVQLVRWDLDPALRQRIKNVLLDAHNDPTAKSVLLAYQETKKFHELDKNAWVAMEEACQLLKIVEEELKQP